MDCKTHKINDNNNNDLQNTAKNNDLQNKIENNESQNILVDSLSYRLPKKYLDISYDHFKEK